MNHPFDGQWRGVGWDREQRGDPADAGDVSRDERFGFGGRGPKDYQRSDERILEDLCDRLRRESRT